MDTAICTVVLAFFVGLANTNAPVPLSEYVQVPGKFMAPIPRNSLTIIRDVSLQLCAAKCTLAFRMKTFPCYAFEYTTGSRMCVHTNMTTLVINGGYLGLQKNPAVNYYERSKASYSNLFQSREHAALKQQNTYFAIKLNQTLEECAYECMRSTAQTCMSFSHSPSSGACGLSNVFYGDGHAEITLVESHIYNHYQYYTSWPCNVTLPENYGPRALASLRFPYQSIRHVQCHMRIEAPVGKQVQILFPTIFFGQDVCNSQTGAGLSVHDGNSGSGPLLGRYCRSTTDRSHPPLLTSASGSMYVTYTADDVPVAFESIYQFVTVDLCVNNKCTNGATCLKTNTSYVCECISGFTGQFCDVNVDDCFSSPCLFQGQCIDEVHGYRCNCTHEFTGKRCEKFIGACRDSPCEHGACVITSRYNYTCTCETGYVGRHCHTRFTPCMSSPCQHGTCGDTADGYVCKCSPGFTGRNCDRLAVDLCTFTPCKHGRCSSTSNLDVLCTCDRGYSGKYCDIIVDYCAAARCQNGSCVSHDNGYTCQCHSGFKGQHCETALTLCEIHAGDCHPGICYPYANLPEGYVCRCPDNTFHRHCNVTSDPCSTSPCHHGACHKVINGYNCTCTTGYKGDHCDVTTCWVADCGLGLCEDTPTGYSCICPIGYGGKNCQVRLTTPTIPVNQSGTDNCLSSPCQHHAICLNQNHGYTCVCQPNWTGSECGERVDVCHGNPCVRGVCVVMGTAHRCDVASNVSSPHGVHARCDVTTCKNGGTCIQSASEVTCICPPGFQGAGCDVKYNACAGYPCPTGLCQIHNTFVRCVVGVLQGSSNSTAAFTGIDIHRSYSRVLDRTSQVNSEAVRLLDNEMSQSRVRELVRTCSATVRNSDVTNMATLYTNTASKYFGSLSNLMCVMMD